MKLLRYLHLYLGCIFAPMLIFFAVSGIWQTFRLQDGPRDQPPSILKYISTIHTSGALKAGSWSSPLMKWFVVIASVSFILSVVLGVIMAYRYGRIKIVSLAIVSGIAIPVLLVLLTKS